MLFVGKKKRAEKCYSLARLRYFLLLRFSVPEREPHVNGMGYLIACEARVESSL